MKAGRWIAQATRSGLNMLWFRALPEVESRGRSRYGLTERQPFKRLGGPHVTIGHRCRIRITMSHWTQHGFIVLHDVGALRYGDPFFAWNNDRRAKTFAYGSRSESVLRSEH